MEKNNAKREGWEKVSKWLFGWRETLSQKDFVTELYNRLQAITVAGDIAF